MLKRASFVVVVLALALAAAAPAWAQSKLTIATGKMFEGVPTEIGQTTCHGGQWLGLPFACSPDTQRITVRNVVTGWYLTDPSGPAAPYLPNVPKVPGQPGPAIFGLNCNLDSKMAGDCWGEFETAVGEGRWVGVWHGKFDLAHLVAEVSLTAHGEGTFKGLELKLDAMGPAMGADFYYLAKIVDGGK